MKRQDAATNSARPLRGGVAVAAICHILLLSSERAMSADTCEAPAVQPPMVGFTTEQVQARIDCLEQVLREIAAELKSSPGEQVLDDLLHEQPLIFPSGSGSSAARPQSVEEATDYLEQLILLERERLLGDSVEPTPGLSSMQVTTEESVLPEGYLVVEDAPRPAPQTAPPEPPEPLPEKIAAPAGAAVAITSEADGTDQSGSRAASPR